MTTLRERVEGLPKLIASWLPDLKTFDGKPIVFDWKADFERRVHWALAAALAAEGQGDGAVLREALQRIARGQLNTPYAVCNCTHDDENCCEKVGEWCPQCIAAIALAAAPSLHKERADELGSAGMTVPKADVRDGLPAEGT